MIYMMKKISFALFDTGETILGALVFSTFFPLYITNYIDTKIYTFFYGLSFGISFILALLFGKVADEKGLRKGFFLLFTALTVSCGIFLYFFYKSIYLAFFIFILMAIFHQQSMVFYNSMLVSFEGRGFTSGLGVSFGYIGSAVSLIFLANILNIPNVFLISALIFLFFSLPSFFFLENPKIKDRISIKEVLKEKKFIFLIISILSLTEVANTLIAIMGIYLREVYGFNDSVIYKVIGVSAVAGVIGGIFWGYLSDRFKTEKIFLFGFFLWIFFLVLLPFTPSKLIYLIGFLAGFSLSHIWTVSRVLIIEKFPEKQVSTRMSFLSLTERIASTTGLMVWSLLLLITENNFELSAFLMVLFPLTGFFFYRAFVKFT